MLEQIAEPPKQREFSLGDMLLPYQRSFVAAPQRKRLFLSGRQLGKSFTIAFAMAYEMCKKPGALGLCISTGARAASELLEKCRKMAEAIKVLSKGSFAYTSNAESVTFSNGSRILSLPSNPDGLRGYTADVVAIDEAAFVPDIDECYQAILPTLTRNKNAKLFVCSTPAGCQGFFYDLWNNADSSWYSQKTTIEDAVAQGLQVNLDELHKLCPDPDIFAQEYQCTFSKEFGAFIDFSLLDYYDELPKCSTSYVGVDVGRHNDNTAVAIVKQDKDIFYVDDIVILHNTAYADQLETIKQLHNAHKFASGFIDCTGIGSAFAEQVSKSVSSRIAGYQITEANKTPSFERLRSMVFEHKVKFNSSLKDFLRVDFQNTYRVITDSGKVKFTSGRNAQGHGDGVMSIVLALNAAHDKPANFGTPQPYNLPSAFGRQTRIYSHF